MPILPDHPLYGVQCKVERAHYHLEEFNAGIQQVFGSNLNPFSEKVDVQNGLYVLRIESSAPRLFSPLGIVVGEIVHNLRSALDNLAWALALENLRGTSRPPYGHTSFPIFKYDTPRTQRKIDKALQHVSSEAKTLIKSMQPYTLGDRRDAHALAVPHSLWNTDKHRVILPSLFNFVLDVPYHPDIRKRTLDDGSIELTMPIHVRDAIGFKPQPSATLTFATTDTIEGQKVFFDAIPYMCEMIKDYMLPQFLQFFPPK